ncbi:MAG: bifunctional demethylmenaquinone methyltransferase/2-methoxy-6-polyprenyl-1,4-benzoquinol methylase UbiE [Myxococcota bacterium]
MNPGVDIAGTAGGSGAMFDSIAQRYDLLNRLMSFGLDRRWRHLLVESLAIDGTRSVLDVATGTADVALALARHYPQAMIYGLDPSERMLEVGREKVSAADLSSRISLVQGDAQQMPFAQNHFAAACVSFGIRNFPDRMQGLREMSRVTRPGGVVAVLELTEPEGRGLIGQLSRFHVHHLAPCMGAWLSRAPQYRYLQRSIEAFPRPEEFMQMMQEAGLVGVKHQRLSFGVATIFVGNVA